MHHQDISAPTLFRYDDATSLRQVGTTDEPWFVAADIADPLGYRMASDLTRRLDADEKGTRSVRTPSGIQQMTVISEAGLYAAILGSRVEGAKRFKRWVTHELLPTIRRTGKYEADRATERQINAAIFQARAQMELCQAAQGLIHPDHLEAKARVILARGMGENAELDQDRRPLYSKDFLKEKNLGEKRMKSIAGVFGKRCKAAYIERHGVEPGKYPLTLSNGQTRDVLAYTEADRDLLEQVWTDYYADPQLEVQA